MELKQTKPIIYLISGKARYGKDTTANFIKEIYESAGKKVINLQFSSYIKEYAKKISGWDGKEETKPRELLQILGTDIIRRKIDEEFFIKKIIDDIKVYSFFFDIITISDVRAKKEIINVSEAFEKVVSININRPNFDNGLTEEQKKHFTEIDLDDFNEFSYILLNDKDLGTLKNKIKEMVGEINEKYN